jgi:hypothetical protein
MRWELSLETTVALASHVEAVFMKVVMLVKWNPDSQKRVR